MDDAACQEQNDPSFQLSLELEESRKLCASLDELCSVFSTQLAALTQDLEEQVRSYNELSSTSQEQIENLKIQHNQQLGQLRDQLETQSQGELDTLRISYENVIKQKDQEINQFKEQLLRLFKYQNDESTTTVSEEKTVSLEKYEQLEDLFRQRDAQTKTLQSEIDSLRKSLRDNESKAQLNQKMTTAVRNELEKSLKEEKALNQNLITHFDQLTAKHNSLKQEFDSLQQNIQEKDQIIQQKDQTIQQNDQIIQQRDQTIKELETRIAEFQDNLQSLQEELRQEKLQRDQLQLDVNELSKQTRTKSNQIDPEFSQNLMEIQKEISQLRTTNQDLEVTRDSLRDELQKLSEHYKKIIATLEAKLSKQTQDHSEKIKQFDQTIRLLEDQVEIITEKLRSSQKLSDSFGTLQKQLRDQNHQIVSYQKEISHLRNLLSEEQKNLQTSKEISCDLQRHILELTNTQSRTTEELRKVHEENQSLHTQLSQQRRTFEQEKNMIIYEILHKQYLDDPNRDNSSSFDVSLISDSGQASPRENSQKTPVKLTSANDERKTLDAVKKKLVDELWRETCDMLSSSTPKKSNGNK